MHYYLHEGYKTHYFEVFLKSFDHVQYGFAKNNRYFFHLSNVSIPKINALALSVSVLLTHFEYVCSSDRL